MNFRNFLLLATGMLVLWSCDASKTVAAGGGDETHSNIDIQGAVFTNRSEPFAGIVVKLRGLGIADTTDSRGAFRIQRADTALATKSGTVDTLDYLREGRIVHSEAVASWTATMPDLFLVQRDISGKLTGAVGAVKTVEAIFGTDRSDTLALEWNPVLGSYSGFAYAPWNGTGTVTHYQVRIEVRDSLRHLIGRSVDIPFTSRAGDLDIPTFQAGNAKPYLRIVGKDTATSRELLELRAVVADSFGQKVTLRWREAGSELRHLVVDTVNGTRFFQTSTDTVVRIAMPGGRDSTFTIHCTATDEDGNIVQDSLVVHRRYTIPFAQFTLSLNGDSVRVHMDASTANKGRLVERRLFLGSQQVMGWTIISNCTGVDTLYLRSGWGDRILDRSSESVPAESERKCWEPVFWRDYSFIKRDSGILVSGRDTTFVMPARDSLGRPFQFAVQLLDEDSQTGVWRSETFTRVAAPESLTLSISAGDSTKNVPNLVHIGWHPGDSISIADQATAGDAFSSWEVSWKGDNVSYTRSEMIIPRSNDSIAFPIPYDQTGC
ncbi:MAG: hypothetical protein AAB214_05755 [Fibrobacterota bacterium]